MKRNELTALPRPSSWFSGVRGRQGSRVQGKKRKVRGREKRGRGELEQGRRLAKAGPGQNFETS